jgi:hypothetical protein
MNYMLDAELAARVAGASPSPREGLFPTTSLLSLLATTLRTTTTTRAATTSETTTRMRATPRQSTHHTRLFRGPSTNDMKK